ncbi:hypothetical protein D3C86_1263640 [compost metagenome]
MAQGQGDRRFEVVVLRGRQHLGEAHDLPVFVRNFDTDRGLARNHFHDTHTGHGQGTCQVFGQVGDAADFYAGRRLDFVTGNHRARMNRIHGDFDAEFLELDFQQVANRSQGFRRIIELFLFCRVENRDRRQGAFHSAVDEQRCLFLFFDTLARRGGLDRRRRNNRRHLLLALGHVLAQGLLTFDQAFLDLGLFAFVADGRRDHVVHTIVDFTQLRDQLLAFGTGRPPTIGGALEQFEQVEGDLAGDVHHLEPRQVGEYGQAEQEQGDEQQRAALNVQRVFGQVAKAFAQRTTRASRQTGRGMEMDMRQRSAGQHQEHQADQTPGKQPAAPLPRLVALTEDLVGLDRQQQREDIGEVTQHHEQDIGAVGARRTAEVLHVVDLAVVAPTRIVLAIGQQGHHQKQAQRTDGDQCTFLEAVVQMLTPERNDCFGCFGGFLQNATFPAPKARPSDECL